MRLPNLSPATISLAFYRYPFPQRSACVQQGLPSAKLFLLKEREKKFFGRRRQGLKKTARDFSYLNWSSKHRLIFGWRGQKTKSTKDRSSQITPETGLLVVSNLCRTYAHERNQHDRCNEPLSFPTSRSFEI